MFKVCPGPDQSVYVDLQKIQRQRNRADDATEIELAKFGLETPQVTEPNK